MPPDTSTPPVEEKPAETPAEEPMTQEQVDALVDETLKEYMPPSIKAADEEKLTAPEVPEEPAEPETPPEEPETPPEEKKVEEPEEKKVEPETATDDDFIEVEDADGNKYKIQKESDLPEDFMPKNNRQVIEILRQLDQLDARKAEKATEAEKEAEIAAAQERQTQVMQGWDNEITSLIDNGILEAPKAKPGTKLWESDPAVQKADSVFKFMIEENKARSEKGTAPITSFAEAYMIQQAREAKNAEAEKIKADNAAAKAKSRLVGRTSAPATNNETYRAGSARSIDDIDI